jgi:hypothetical protein
MGKDLMRKLNELEVRNLHTDEITNTFVAMENFSDDTDINRAWENIKENSKTTPNDSLVLHELKQHKPWFQEECLGFKIKGCRLKSSEYRIQAEAM